MKALLLIAHGSRKASSNEEVEVLAQSLSSHNHDFDIISHGFLELTTPKVSDAIEALVAKGATDITLLPYFLAAGVHVSEDLPLLMANAKKQHEGIQFKLLKHLGAAEQMADWILGYADNGRNVR